MQRNESQNELDLIPEKISCLRRFFVEGKTHSLNFRLKQLGELRQFLIDHEADIADALKQDLAKPKMEALMTEINVVKSEIDYTIKHLTSWVRPQALTTMFAIKPASAKIYPEPLGVVLVISPWNYPFQLAMLPLVGAIAAGNTVMLKPSELARATSKLLAGLLPSYLDEGVIQVVEGGVAESQAVLKHPFDHIFFTGSKGVGKEILRAAAEHLTPCTLELGGKSPCIVMADANLDQAAERIAWGKFTNAGQTCIAPDYLLVEESIKETFLLKLTQQINRLYSNDEKSSDAYGRIINERHFERLKNMIAQSKNIFYGGDLDQAEKYIQPTIIDNVTFQDAIMYPDNEIFGPILPVLSFKTRESVVKEINARPKPLTFYLYTSSVDTRDYFLKNTSSGSFVQNHCLIQGGLIDFPFGGVGQSGMGRYHGKDTFDVFSNKKSVLLKSDSAIYPDFTQLIYPPYTDNKEKLIDLGIKFKML